MARGMLKKTQTNLETVLSRYKIEEKKEKERKILTVSNFLLTPLVKNARLTNWWTEVSNCAFEAEKITLSPLVSLTFHFKHT